MRRPSVKRLSARLEASLSAAAFAEEREVETARQILAEPAAPDRRRRPAKGRPR